MYLTENKAYLLDGGQSAQVALRGMNAGDRAQKSGSM